MSCAISYPCRGRFSSRDRSINSALPFFSSRSGTGDAIYCNAIYHGTTAVKPGSRASCGEEVVSMIHDAGGTASFQRTDVSVAAEVEALVDYTITTYGRLDLAFNNAGIEGEMKPTLVDQTEANFDAVMDINVKGVWLCMKYEIPKCWSKARRHRELLVGRRRDRIPGNRDLCC